MQRKLSFATLCLHVKENCKAYEESSKACEESDKACEESDKAPCENALHPFFGNFFCSFEDSLKGYSRSLFQKESPRGQHQFLCF